MDRGTGYAALTLALFLAAHAYAAPSAPAMPPGYFIDPAQAAAARPVDRVLADGDFTLAIHRRYADPTEANLLAIAEATYPPRERLIDRALSMDTQIGSDSSGMPLWWCDGVGVGRVPYAITAGALAYYTMLTEHFREHDFRETGTQNLVWADFSYTASITPRDHYYLEDRLIADVYVAEMNLSWSFDDGTFVPTSTAHRIVVLTRDGAVIAVLGDGGTQEEMAMSTRRRPTGTKAR
jgi:hypothetical protein